MRFLASAIRARAEEFGYIVALPNGKVDLFDPAVAAILSRRPDELVAEEELLPYILDEMSFSPEQFHLRSPIVATLELTRRCGLRCQHCYIDGGDPRPSELPPEAWFSLLTELAARGVFAVHLTGGEPLLHPRALDLVDHAHALGLVVSLSTNGSLLTPAVVERLPRKEFGVGLSVDGIVSNETLRGIAFDELARAAMLLKDAGIPFNIRMTRTRTNLDEACQLIDWCAERRIAALSVDVQPLGRAKKHPELFLTSDDVARDMDFLRKERLGTDAYLRDVDRRDSLFFTTFLDFCYRLNTLTGRCKGAKSLVYVASDGELYPCYSCAAEGILSGGNIQKRPFGALWEDGFEAMRSIEWSSFAVCSTCELGAGECAGRCVALSAVMNEGLLTGCGAAEFRKTETRMFASDPVLGRPLPEPGMRS